MLRVPLVEIDNRQKSLIDDLFKVFPRLDSVHLAAPPLAPDAPKPLARDVRDRSGVPEQAQQSTALTFEIFEDDSDVEAEKLVDADASLLCDLEAVHSPTSLQANVGATRTSLTIDSDSPVTECSPFGPGCSTESADSWSPLLADEGEHSPLDYVALTYFDQLPGPFVEKLKQNVESMEQFQHTQTRIIRQLRRENFRLRALQRPSQNVKRHAVGHSFSLERSFDIEPPACSESEHGGASAISAAFSEDFVEAPPVPLLPRSPAATVIIDLPSLALPTKQPVLPVQALSRAPAAHGTWPRASGSSDLAQGPPELSEAVPPLAAQAVPPLAAMERGPHFAARSMASRNRWLPVAPPESTVAPVSKSMNAKEREQEPDAVSTLHKLRAHRDSTQRHQANLQELLLQASGFSSDMHLVQQELQETRAHCNGMLRKIETAISAAAST